MNLSQFQTIYPTFTPSSPGLPQAPGDGQYLYSWGFSRISPSTPLFFKLRRKGVYTPPLYEFQKSLRNLGKPGKGKVKSTQAY
jgi:hypothetical protein